MYMAGTFLQVLGRYIWLYIPDRYLRYSTWQVLIRHSTFFVPVLPQHLKYLRSIVLFRYLPESIIKVHWVESTWQVHVVKVLTHRSKKNSNENATTSPRKLPSPSPWLEGPKRTPKPRPKPSLSHAELFNESAPGLHTPDQYNGSVSVSV